MSKLNGAQPFDLIREGHQSIGPSPNNEGCDLPIDCFPPKGPLIVVPLYRDSGSNSKVFNSRSLSFLVSMLPFSIWPVFADQARSVCESVKSGADETRYLCVVSTYSSL